MLRFRKGSRPSRIILAAILAATLTPLGYSQTARAVPGISHNVSTCAGLQTLGANGSTSGDTINLTADLDCDGIDFSPLYAGGEYTGTFDGHGHSIENLTVNHPGSQWQGLIAKASNATIKNLILASGSVSGGQYVGGLIGQARGVTVSNVRSHVDVNNSEQFMGGLIGNLSGTGTSLIQDVAVTGDVTTPGGFMGASYIGGLIGVVDVADATSVTIRRASSTGNVSVTSSGNRVGGLIGNTFVFSNAGPSSVLVEDAYATGNVSGGSSSFEVGGLIGSTQPNGAGDTAAITLSRTYAAGTVSGNDGVGGLIGVHDAAGNGSVFNINDSFAVGHVTANASRVAGLVGANYFSAPEVSVATNSYYDGPGTSQSTCATQNNFTGDCTQIDTGATPNYFKGNRTNAPFTNWDFAGTWRTNAGAYPTLIPANDGDGIDKANEAAAPNDGDANGDGVPDAAQPGVASFSNPVTGQYAVLETSCGSLYNTEVGAESTTAGATDMAYTYPGGLMRFVATGCTPNATATITQTYYGLNPVAPYTMRKSNGGTYTTIPGAVFSAATIGGQSALQAEYQVTDGSALDDDGLANGNIVDPAGPAIAVLGVPSTGLGARSH